MRRRVVVTGIGLHTPLGDDPHRVFDALLAGASAIRREEQWLDVPDLHTAVCAPVPHFDGKHIPRKMRRTMGRVAQLAASAASAAAERAQLPDALLQDGRTAVVVGSTAGSGATEYAYIEHLVRTGSPRGIRSTAYFQVMSHTCAANVALYLGITGEILATNAACASSNQAIGIAAQRIRHGYCDRAIAGGAEELHLLSAMIFNGVNAASHSYNDRPGATPRPFDAARDGIVVGEGAGMLVLEAREEALARGAPILAEVLGHANRCDARHIVSPEPAGMIRTVRAALRDAGLSPDEVDYVNAHATGTREGDASEAEALFTVFGNRVPVSSSKGHLGHTLGACGAIETAICIEALTRGVVPPTRNLVEPDVAPLDLLREPRSAPIRIALNTNFAFGGVNSCLLLGHAKEV